MAGRTRSTAKHAYRFFAPVPELTGPTGAGPVDEFDESDIWGVGPAEPKPAELTRSSVPVTRPARKKPVDRSVGHGSLPLNIPDWSKILGVEYRGRHGGGEWEADGDEDGEMADGAVIPPHELLWRSRGASMSVHEGIGRTLKGRDLSRVRDAVWKKTGFDE